MRPYVLYMRAMRRHLVRLAMEAELREGKVYLTDWDHGLRAREQPSGGELQWADLMLITMFVE